MKILFASLLMHRDVDTFIFNWFCCRLHLANGFSIPHLILNDGSLTAEDISRLKKLTHILIEEEPVKLYKCIGKEKHLAKIKLLEYGFMKYNADKIVIFDADIFFLRPWDTDLNDILLSEAMGILDYGSSCGPEPETFKRIFGIYEDEHNPNCNTGVFSITRELYPQVLLRLTEYLEEPFNTLGDQGILFAAVHGHLKLLKDIRIIIDGAEDHPAVWEWMMGKKALHLPGMRVKTNAYNLLINKVLELLPSNVHLSRFSPVEYHITGGRLAYDLYNFDHKYKAFPSTCAGMWVVDALYMSGDSYIRWVFPPQIKKFEASFMPLDNSDPSSLRPVCINGRSFDVRSFFSIDIPNQELIIRTEPGERAFYALTYPHLLFSLDRPTTSLE